MKRLLILIVSTLLSLSCESSRQNSYEDIQEELEKSVSQFIQSNPDEAINSLKFVVLRKNRYYLDEDAARKASVDEKILKKLQTDIFNVNKALDDREKFIRENKKDIREYEIELIDFQKLKMDSLKEQYHNKNNFISVTSGDMSTTGQSERVITVFNYRYKKVSFRG